MRFQFVFRRGIVYLCGPMSNKSILPLQPVTTVPLRSVLLSVLILFAPWARGAAGLWPEFRGPTGQGTSSATNIPLTWNATSNVLWRVEVPGRGWSSPVVAQGRIYLTTAATGAEGAEVSLRALCFSAADGTLLWNSQVFQPEAGSAEARHKKNSPASATPIVRGDRLYVHFGHMGTAALDLSGKVLWRQDTIKYSPVHGNGGSPVLVGDTLIFSCDGIADPFFIALDAGSGAIRWKTPRNTPARKTFSFSTPLEIEIDGIRQIISPTSGFVAAYQAKDGHEIWKARYGEGYSLVPRPVFAHGLLFITTGFDTASLLAIKPSGAHGDVTESNIVWTHKKGVPTTPSLLALGEELYFVSDGGVATCLDAKTGQVNWSERLEGGFSASPFSAEGRIYFQNEAGVGFVLAAGPSFKLLARNALGERTLASCAVIDNALFIRSESHLWKIGRPSAR